MLGGNDSHRSELPSPRRLREARRRGDVPFSAHAVACAALLAGACVISLRGPAIARQAIPAIRECMDRATSPGLDVAGVLATAAAAGREIAVVSLPIVLTIALAAAVVGFLQTGVFIAPAAIRPSLERLDVLQGLRRSLFSARPFRSGFRSTLWMLVIVLAGGIAIWSSLPELLRLELLEPASIGARASALTVRTAFWALLPCALFAPLDIVLERRRHRRALMMTREELLRELKEDQGSFQRALHESPPDQGVSLTDFEGLASAQVLVTDGDRFACALRWDGDPLKPPHVCIRAMTDVVRLIRSAAARGVPTLRHSTLAAQLRELPLGVPVPARLYGPVADALQWARRFAGVPARAPERSPGSPVPIAER